MNQIRIHKPEPVTAIPAHERAAATRRRQDANLPAIPGLRPPRPPKPRPPPGRKTFETRINPTPNPFGNP